MRRIYALSMLQIVFAILSLFCSSLFSYPRRLNLSTAFNTFVPVPVFTRHTGPVELRQRLNLVALDAALLLFRD
jgi:hypothetical protein